MREPAEPCRSAPASARGGIAAAVHGLPWLAPGVSSLVELSRAITPYTWNAVCHDPGAVLLLVRCASDRPPDQLLDFLHEPAPLRLALRLLNDPVFPDWRGVVAGPVYRFAVRAAELAGRLATSTGRANADAARVCALLAPLGWMAVCAIDPGVAEGCLSDRGHAAGPSGTQKRWWGLDQAAIARRLARRWQLPGWLALGRLGLPSEVAGASGATEDLFHVTRLAVALAGRQGPGLGLVDTAAELASAAALGVEPEAFAGECPHPTGFPREDPKSQPLLRDLLSAAAENRELRCTPRLDRLEDEADTLHRAFEQLERSHAVRLQEAKLTALAEFAAGAGHEINNPLAVIVGQAQYALGHEAAWFVAEFADEARQALQKIVGQTRRIHALLRDLMLFARPAPPAPAWHDLPGLLGEVAASLRELAEQRQVCLSTDARPDRLPAFLDAGQMKVALTCLLRNAIEAAPAGGKARLVFHDHPGSDTLQVLVEDDGVGPDAAMRASLFDPFFSGRSAGRGRGLGLPTAWRLVRQQGGEVHLEPARAGEPTRFVLTLPRVHPSDELVQPSSLLETFLAAPAPAPTTNGCSTS